MAKPKKKFYVVWKGKETGVFDSWDKCKKQIEGFTGAQYKSFATKEAAVNAFGKSPRDFIGKDVFTTTLSAAFQHLATTTTLAYSPSPGTPTYQSDAQVKTTQDSATIQAVSQAGPSGNTLLILSFIVPLALAISVYLVLKRR